MQNKAESKVPVGIRDCVVRADAAALCACIEQLFTTQKYSPSELLKLHDDIQFALAYAPDKNIFDGCKTALRLMPEVVRPGTLQNSGISGTSTVSSYSFTLLHWIYKRSPHSLTFHSFENPSEDVGELIRFILPKAEAEICTFGFGKQKLFTKLCGGRISIGKILSLFSSCEDKNLREFVFSRMGIFVELRNDSKLADRTSAFGPMSKPFYHSEVLKKIDHSSLISQRLPKKEIRDTLRDMTLR